MNPRQRRLAADYAKGRSDGREILRDLKPCSRRCETIATTASSAATEALRAPAKMEDRQDDDRLRVDDEVDAVGELLDDRAASRLLDDGELRWALDRTREHAVELPQEPRAEARPPSLVGGDGVVDLRLRFGTDEEPPTHRATRRRRARSLTCSACAVAPRCARGRTPSRSLRRGWRGAPPPARERGRGATRASGSRPQRPRSDPTAARRNRSARRPAARRSRRGGGRQPSKLLSRRISSRSTVVERTRVRTRRA